MYIAMTPAVCLSCHSDPRLTVFYWFSPFHQVFIMLTKLCFRLNQEFLLPHLGLEASDTCIKTSALFLSRLLWHVTFPLQPFGIFDWLSCCSSASQVGSPINPHLCNQKYFTLIPLRQIYLNQMLISFCQLSRLDSVLKLFCHLYYVTYQQSDCILVQAEPTPCFLQVCLVLKCPPPSA